VICEVMKDDGTMARLPDLQIFAARARTEDRHHRRPHRLPQPQRDRWSKRIGERPLQTAYGEFECVMPFATRPASGCTLR
jgi:3,4-dihydroxy 2-butanone 4-phosphate synthase/GTP cyclohydrolase II